MVTLMCPQLLQAHRDTLTLSKFLHDICYKTFYSHWFEWKRRRKIKFEWVSLRLREQVINKYLFSWVFSCACFRYSVTNRLHEKSDVFSFGVVLLELITGRNAIDRSHEKAHISQWVNFMLSDGDITDVVDQRLHGDFDINSVWKAAEIAMACVSPTSARRPSMNQVVTELKDCVEMESSRKISDSLVTDSTTSIEAYSVSPSNELRPLAR